MLKICSKCKRELDITMFSKNCKSKDGYKQQCKNCDKKYKEDNKEILREKEKQYREQHKQQIKEYYHNNKYKNLQRKKQYYQQNKDKLEQYRKNNKEKRRVYMNSRYKSDNRYKIDVDSANLMTSILKGRIKNSPTLLLRCGYTAEQLRQYIELQFTLEMNWGNYGIYWEIDHIIPKNLFNYISYDDESYKQCWKLSNLRPLSKKENRLRSKSLF